MAGSVARALLLIRSEATGLADGMRDQSKAEIVFVLVRVLVTGRLLWGGGLSLANLRPLLRASSTQVAHALDDLRDEGMVFVDRRQGTVHLTDRAFRELSE